MHTGLQKFPENRLNVLQKLREFFSFFWNYFRKILIRQKPVRQLMKCTGFSAGNPA